MTSDSGASEAASPQATEREIDGVEEFFDAWNGDVQRLSTWLNGRPPLKTEEAVAALKWIYSSAPEDRINGSVMAIIRAAESPAEVFILTIAALPDAAGREQFQVEVVKLVVARSAPEAATMISHLRVSPDVRMQATEAVVEAWWRSDLQGTVKWIETLSEEVARSAAFREVLQDIERQSGDDYGSVLAGAFNSVSDPGMRSQIAERIVEKIATVDTEAALDLLFADEAARQAGRIPRQLIDELAKVDFELGASLVGTLPSTSARYQGFGDLAASAVLVDPDRVISVLTDPGSPVEPAARWSAMSRAFSSFVNSHGTAATMRYATELEQPAARDEAYTAIARQFAKEGDLDNARLVAGQVSSPTARNALTESLEGLAERAGSAVSAP